MKRNHFINLFVCCVVLLVSCMNVWAQTPDPYLSQPLTFVAEEDMTITLAKTSSAPSVTITDLQLQYSINGGETWTSVSTTAISLIGGQSLMMKRNPANGIGSTFGYTNSSYYDSRYWYFKTTGNFHLEGNIMSLMDGANFATNTTIPQVCCFGYLFLNNTKLTDISNLRLPATTLKNRCYHSLFEGCAGLTDISHFVLPEPVSVGTYSYFSMFKGCTGLTSLSGFRVPSNLGTYDCYNMFNGCTGLTTLKDFILPASTLAEGCYQSMFKGCIGLTTFGNFTFPIVDLALYSCRYMFSGCTNLETTMPKLEFGTIAQEACSLMFQNCQKLRATPMIEVDSIGSKGCCQMFSGCGPTTGTDSLIAGDIIVHKAIYNNGCTNMFSGSSRLANIPNVTVGRIMGASEKGGCYQMFYDLGGVRYGGTFRADRIDSYGCQQMHNKCSNLARYDSVIIDTVGSYGVTSLFANCSKLERMPKIKIRALGGDHTMQFMFNGCKSLTFNNDTLFNKKLTNSCYLAMFNGCTGIDSISGLHIAADTLAPYACCSLFYDCSNMIKVGDTLKFKVIGDHSCQYMFYGCTHLKQTPVLLVDSIGSSGCNLMFQKCGTALTGTDSLIAGDIIVHKTIYNNGCTNMFSGSSRLANIPNVTVGRIMGASEKGGCYQMFYDLGGVRYGGTFRADRIDSYGCQQMHNKCSKLGLCDKIAPERVNFAYVTK